MMRFTFYKLLFTAAFICSAFWVGEAAFVKQAHAESAEDNGAEADELQELVERPPYSFDMSLRDPFQPVAVERRADPAEDCGPLCNFDLAQLRITGIIWGLAESVAMVRAPDGKSYVVKVGMPIGRNNGKVVSVMDDRIVVLEQYVNYRGEVVSNRVDVQLAQREGARR
jgi:type IV pilus assembly protein PilP